VKLARDLFEKCHHNDIANLLKTFPKNYVDKKTELKFWTAPKRFPNVIKYDGNEKQTSLYIHAAANIFSYVFGCGDISLEDCVKIGNTLFVEEF